MCDTSICFLGEILWALPTGRLYGENNLQEFFEYQSAKFVESCADITHRVTECREKLCFNVTLEY
jgi:hypothetical protein